MIGNDTVPLHWNHAAAWSRVTVNVTHKKEIYHGGMANPAACLVCSCVPLGPPLPDVVHLAARHRRYVRRFYHGRADHWFVHRRYPAAHGARFGYLRRLLAARLHVRRPDWYGLAVTSGSQEIGLAIAVPAGVLLVQLDVLARFTNTYFQHFCEKACANKNWKMVKAGVVMGLIPWALSRIVPMLACLMLGQEAISVAAEVAPDWLINGFNFVGRILPSVGLAILLRYLPLSRYWMYALLGFFLAAYLKVPVLGVAIVGLVAAALMYNNLNSNAAQPSVAAAGVSAGDIEGTIDDDE